MRRPLHPWPRGLVHIVHYFYEIFTLRNASLRYTYFTPGFSSSTLPLGGRSSLGTGEGLSILEVLLLDLGGMLRSL